jgi:hypothetical protein
MIKKLGLWLCDKIPIMMLSDKTSGLESRSGTRRSPLPVHRDGAVPDLELACGGAVSLPGSPPPSPFSAVPYLPRPPLLLQPPHPPSMALPRTLGGAAERRGMGCPSR